MRYHVYTRYNRKKGGRREGVLTPVRKIGTGITIEQGHMCNKKTEYIMNAHEIYSVLPKTMVVVLEIYSSKFYYNVQYLQKN